MCSNIFLLLSISKKDSKIPNIKDFWPTITGEVFKLKRSKKGKKKKELKRRRKQETFGL